MSKQLEPFERIDAELVDETEFFAPVASDLLDSLLGQYQAMRKRVEAVSELMTAETSGAIQYYLDAYSSGSNHSSYMPTVSALFVVEKAVAKLNGAYWSKTMSLTDVYDAMPQARRDEWNRSIKDMTTPDFEESTVRSTITGLLAMRSQFLSERVDGIFRNLSGDHVTNCPEAFGKRMILSYVLNEYSSVGHTKSGLINDLRCVIAKFMGRGEPKHYASSRLIETLKNRWGEWVTVDGGALRIRLYKKGTAHLEVHPDMAWRLNQILAHIHPRAIPAQFRQRPVKKAKTFAMMSRPLPFAVVNILSEVKPYIRGSLTMTLPAYMQEFGKAAWNEAAAVLQSIGGVQTAGGNFTFDYNPKAVIDDIVTSGCIPDQKSHQYYPTPPSLARRAIEIAEIEGHHTCLEPSAGMGGLFDLMPREKTTCVEVSELHCQVLRAKEARVYCADFIAWSQDMQGQGVVHDRIVMNPPFSEGRWQAHLLAAASLVRPGGRLVSVLPSSAAKNTALPGFSLNWHGPFDNEFAGTSVSVVILSATRAVASV